MRHPASLLLLTFTPCLGAQGATAVVAGRVWTHSSHRQVSEAQVSINDDTLTTSHALTARTSETGFFVIPGVAPGRHRLVVRRIGYGVATRMIDVGQHSHDTVDVELYGANERTPADSVTAAIAEADYQRRLAAARARPRHWTCERRPDVVREYAEAWAWLANPDGGDPGEWKRNPWHLPRDSAAFVRAFRPIISSAECRRLGLALDKRFGQISDSLTVFRMGSVYLMPTRDTGGGLVLDLKGKVIAAFIIPD